MIDNKFIQRNNGLNELPFGHNKLVDDNEMCVLPLERELSDISNSFDGIDDITMDRLVQEIIDNSNFDPDGQLEETKNDSLSVVEASLCTASTLRTGESVVFPNDFGDFSWLEVSAPTSSFLDYSSDGNFMEQQLQHGLNCCESDISSILTLEPSSNAECEDKHDFATIDFSNNVTQSQVILTIPESSTAAYNVYDSSDPTIASVSNPDDVKLEPQCVDVSLEETMKLETVELNDTIAPLSATDSSEKVGSRDSGKRLVRKRCSESVTSQTSISDDDYDSDDESNSDCSDDNDSLGGVQEFAIDFFHRGCNQTPYFWQYNAQNRGPKGRRLHGAIKLKDAHVLDDFVDPVTNEATKQPGNDPRPSPDKLLELGSRIKTLEEEFKSLSVPPTPVSKSDINRRKNMMASRICRLKRKALHEANKIKLSGLTEEHRQLQTTIANLVSVMIPSSSQLRLKPVSTVKPSKRNLETSAATGIVPASTSKKSYGEKYSKLEVSNVVEPTPSHSKFSPWGILSSLTSYLSAQIRQNLKYMIAGHTTDYVNMELRRVAWRLSGQQSQTD